MTVSVSWSQHDLDVCREMLLAGHTDEVIAVAVGRTPGAIRHKRCRMVGQLQDHLAVARTQGGLPRDVVMDNRHHLVDLMRSFGGKTLGEAKAEYRRRCELDIDPGYTNVTHTVMPYSVNQSFIGSQFAD